MIKFETKFVAAKTVSLLNVGVIAAASVGLWAAIIAPFL